MSAADPGREPRPGPGSTRRREDAAAQQSSAQRALATLGRELEKHAQVKGQLEREREKHARTRDELGRQRERYAAIKDALSTDREKHARTKEELRLVRDERASLKAELDELRGSYHLAGAAKKLDLRELDGFSEIAARTVEAGRTGMSYDRLYTLWQAVRTAPPDAAVIEIGSYRGGSARFIGDAFLANGRVPRIYVCDTFAGHAQTDATIDVVHRDKDKFKGTSAREVKEYLSGYPSIEVVVGDIMETSGRFADKVFGFVHLDVDVYPATAFCLRFFAPRLAGDAVMVIDDYGFVTCPGVKQAADEFVAEFPEFRLWHLLTGQALLSRLAAPLPAVPLADPRRAAS